MVVFLLPHLRQPEISSSDSSSFLRVLVSPLGLIEGADAASLVKPIATVLGSGLSTMAASRRKELVWGERVV
jgi:hypothetical protein